MALVDIHLLEGVFSEDQKTAMIAKVTDALVEVEGEALRGLTWVRIREVAGNEWGIGGRALTAADLKALRGEQA